MAAREMSDRGLSVLMLEARDRIGGRTYTVEEDGKSAPKGLLAFTNRSQVFSTKWAGLGSRTTWRTYSLR
ncbi:hypothetical protein N7541_002687 [Penicillium brevicompactum]|uniref:Amine oxidase domain-containing protein n=1 Tax=Penicillium brevicompactum TaxID=5074 RepID=A0A9W9RQB0_PENBR|nr:hypothetical protein N7541_002687 [Penicillium brevicompactum]